jgi:hypothetical protein
MKIGVRTLISAWLFLISSVALCEQLNEGQSPSGKLHYELRTTPNHDGEKAIWLWSKDDKSDAQQLCETGGWGYLEVHFSPDDNWIVLQDGGASLGVLCRLFRLRQGLVFREIQKPDLNAEAEKLALQKAGLPAQTMSDHQYVRCLGWSGDSKMILIQSRGNGKIGKLGVGYEWIGIYHVEDGHFSFDLSEFDRRAVDKEPLD